MGAALISHKKVLFLVEMHLSFKHTIHQNDEKKEKKKPKKKHIISLASFLDGK